MRITKITPNERVTIPLDLRKKYKRTKHTREIIKANAGFMGTKGKLLKALMEEKKKEKNL